MTPTKTTKLSVRYAECMALLLAASHHTGDSTAEINKRLTSALPMLENLVSEVTALRDGDNSRLDNKLHDYADSWTELCRALSQGAEFASVQGMALDAAMAELNAAVAYHKQQRLIAEGVIMEDDECGIGPIEDDEDSGSPIEDDEDNDPSPAAKDDATPYWQTTTLGERKISMTDITRNYVDSLYKQALRFGGHSMPIATENLRNLLTGWRIAKDAYDLLGNESLGSLDVMRDYALNWGDFCCLILNGATTDTLEKIRTATTVSEIQKLVRDELYAQRGVRLDAPWVHDTLSVSK